MDGSDLALLLGGVAGVITALGTFFGPIVVALIQSRRPPPPSPAAFPDDPPVTDDDPVTDKLLVHALVQEVRYWRDRARDCEQGRSHDQ